MEINMITMLSVFSARGDDEFRVTYDHNSNQEVHQISIDFHQQIVDIGKNVTILIDVIGAFDILLQ